MPNSKLSYLIELVKVLDKSEKRSFKIQSGQITSPTDKLYVKLFDLIDRTSSQDDAYFRKKLQISNLQYTNLKRHLYSVLLKSLRVSYTSKDESYQLKELSDHAHILFEKGLHKQSADIIVKLKPLAIKRHETRLVIELIELQKKIESRFITRSRGIKNKMESIILQSEASGDSLMIINKLSNLCLKIQGLYIKVGYARDERDSELYKAFFYSNLPHVERSRHKPIERIYWHQAHVWYHHSCLNFHLSYRHAVMWVESFHIDTTLIQHDYSNYIKGIDYILRQCYYLNSRDRFNHWYAVLEQTRKSKKGHQSRVNMMIDFTRYNTIRLNYIVLNNKYSQLHKIVKEIALGQEHYGKHLDEHRHYVFSYKIATAYSYIGNYDKAIDYCNHVIVHNKEFLKKDVAPYSRLLHIMCHFRLNNFQLVENMVDSIKAEFLLYRQDSIAVDLILNFLKKASRAMNFGLDDDIIKLQNRLIGLRTQQYDKLPFIYYDFVNWCQSLLNNTTIEKHIKQQ